MILSNAELIADCKRHLKMLRNNGSLTTLLERFEARFGFEDGDGFTAEDLKKIAEWDYKDLGGLLEFVETIWWCPEWGFVRNEMPGGEWIELHTGGWSGNEQIIHALQQNFMFWGMCWARSERGGHYYFRWQR